MGNLQESFFKYGVHSDSVEVSRTKKEGYTTVKIKIGPKGMDPLGPYPKWKSGFLYLNLDENENVLWYGKPGALRYWHVFASEEAADARHADQTYLRQT